MTSNLRLKALTVASEQLTKNQHIMRWELEKEKVKSLILDTALEKLPEILCKHAGFSASTDAPALKELAALIAAKGNPTGVAFNLKRLSSEIHIDCVSNIGYELSNSTSVLKVDLFAVHRDGSVCEELTAYVKFWHAGCEDGYAFQLDGFHLEDDLQETLLSDALLNYFNLKVDIPGFDFNDRFDKSVYTKSPLILAGESVEFAELLITEPTDINEEFSPDEISEIKRGFSNNPSLVDGKVDWIYFTQGFLALDLTRANNVCEILDVEPDFQTYFQKKLDKFPGDVLDKNFFPTVPQEILKQVDLTRLKNKKSNSAFINAAQNAAQLKQKANTMVAKDTVAMPNMSL